MSTNWEGTSALVQSQCKKVQVQELPGFHLSIPYKLLHHFFLAKEWLNLKFNSQFKVNFTNIIHLGGTVYTVISQPEGCRFSCQHGWPRVLRVSLVSSHSPRPDTSGEPVRLNLPKVWVSWNSLKWTGKHSKLKLKLEDVSSLCTLWGLAPATLWPCLE